MSAAPRTSSGQKCLHDETQRLGNKVSWAETQRKVTTGEQNKTVKSPKVIAESAEDPASPHPLLPIINGYHNGITQRGQKVARSVVQEPAAAAAPQKRKASLATNGSHNRRPEPARISKVWPSKGQQARGLSNPGLLCYRRALLVSLLSVPQFFNVLDQSKDHCNASCVTCAFRQLARSYHTPGQSPHAGLAALDRAVKNARKSGEPRWTASVNGQEDSHEFLQFLLGRLEKAPGVAAETFRSLCGITHTVTWTCQRCGKVHNRTEPQDSILRLPVASPNKQQTPTLSSCLQTDHRNDNVTITCDGCKKTSPRSRLYQFQHTPELLQIQLKRFAYNRYGSATKITRRVSFGETLDIAPWCKDSSKPVMYQLQAVVMHRGTLRQGHYIAYMRRGKEVWKLDDDRAQKVQEADMLSHPEGFTPYLLFYVKQ